MLYVYDITKSLTDLIQSEKLLPSADLERTTNPLDIVLNGLAVLKKRHDSAQEPSVTALPASGYPERASTEAVSTVRRLIRPVDL